MNTISKKEVMALAAEMYRDELMVISLRLKAYHIHEMALRGEIFYNHKDALAAAYRLDHTKDDLFIEAKRIDRMIIALNTAAKNDPYIGSPFLSRRYQVREMPDPKIASNDEIAAYFRDVYTLIEDFEDLLYEAEQKVIEK